MANDLLQDITAETDVFAELIGRLIVDNAMPETMGGNFVAGGLDLADQRGVPLGSPAENKERRLDGMFSEQGEQALRIGDNSAGKVAPLIASDRRFKGRHLKVFLDVDRKCVDKFHVVTGLGQANQ